MRLPLSVYRSRIGVQWADPSVRPSCVVTPRYSRWFMDGRSAPLSRPQKEWDSKMYPQTLSRHESERATLWLSRSWRVGLWGVCNTPLRIRQEERLPLQLSHPQKEWESKMYPLTFSRHESGRATLGLSRPWRGGRCGVCNTPLPCRKEEGSALQLSHPRKGWDSKMYPQTLSRHESERATLELFRPWWGGRWADVFAPLRIRQEERSALGLSRPRKGWESKMYPQTLSRHESERATIGLSCPWRGGRGGVCNTPLPCWKEERTILWLSCPWRVELWGVCNTPLQIRQEERLTLWLSRSWRGGRGADIFATCPYSFLVTITPRLTFHF